MLKRSLILALPLTLSSTPLAFAADPPSGMQGEIDALKNRINQLEDQLATQKPLAESSSTQTTSNMLGGLQLSGGFELTYGYKAFDKNGEFGADATESESKRGDSGFNDFHLNFDSKQGPLSASISYWWYSYMELINHAWVGYDVSDTTQLQLGVTKVPFGILPLPSNNWWYGSAFYVGFEDNYDMGLKLIYDQSPLNVQLAFFKNEEWKNSSKLERYGYDIVTKDEQANEKTNQLNARVTYTLNHGDSGKTELGVSGQYGQLYNKTTDEMGDHWAAGLHLDGQYGNVYLKLQALQYQFTPENPLGMSNKTVLMGAFTDAYPVAAEGSIVIANVGYDVPVKWGAIKSLYFYNDYSVLMKTEDGFEDSPMNITGLLITAGPAKAFIDFIIAKNTPYVGFPLETALAEGNPDADWEPMLNITFAYEF